MPYIRYGIAWHAVSLCRFFGLTRHAPAADVSGGEQALAWRQAGTRGCSWTGVERRSGRLTNEKYLAAMLVSSSVTKTIKASPPAGVITLSTTWRPYGQRMRQRRKSSVFPAYSLFMFARKMAAFSRYAAPGGLGDNGNAADGGREQAPTTAFMAAVVTLLGQQTGTTSLTLTCYYLLCAPASLSPFYLLTCFVHAVCACCLLLQVLSCGTSFWLRLPG